MLEKGEGAQGSLSYAKFTFTPRGDRFRGGDQLGTSLSWACDSCEPLSSKSNHRSGKQEELLGTYYSRMLILSSKRGVGGLLQAWHGINQNSLCGLGT
jgi:hypothetical protein